MTWGSPSYVGNDQSCLNCKHQADCRGAVRANNGGNHQEHHQILCEDIPEQASPVEPVFRSYRSRNFAAHIQPGELITSRQLAERTGATTATASSWCLVMKHRGILQVVGEAPTGRHGGQRPCIYRYAPSEAHR